MSLGPSHWCIISEDWIVKSFIMSGAYQVGVSLELRIIMRIPVLILSTHFVRQLLHAHISIRLLSAHIFKVFKF